MPLEWVVQGGFPDVGVANNKDAIDRTLELARGTGTVIDFKQVDKERTDEKGLLANRYFVRKTKPPSLATTVKMNNRAKGAVKMAIDAISTRSRASRRASP